MPDQTSGPLVPIPTLQSQPQSPQAIAELRRYIAALQQQRKSNNPFYTWANGLDDMSRSITGAILSNRADDLERQRLRTAAAGDLPENPYSATGDNSPAAPGGAAPIFPFSQTSTPQTGSGAAEGTPDNLTAFIKDREGFRSAPYPDGKQTSIGYGTRAQPGETSISRDDAEARLNKEVGNAAQAVDNFAPNLPPQIRNALTDLTYNTGTKWQQSGLGQAVKAGDWQTAQGLFQQYNKANGQESPGLVARRQALAPAFAGATNPDGNALFQDLSKLGTAPALAFSGEPTTANPLAGAPAGARLAQAGGGPPPGAATPQAAQANPLAPQVAPRDKPFVPWASIPRPTPMSRDAAINAHMAADTDAQRKMISDRYMQQFQPVVIPYGNGYISANFANGTQTFFSTPKDIQYKIGGGEIPAKVYTDPITGRDRPELTVPGAQGQPQRPAAVPQAPAPTAPPRFAPTDAELASGTKPLPVPMPAPAKFGTPEYQKAMNAHLDQTPDVFPDPNEAFAGGLKGIEKHNAAVKAYEGSNEKDRELLLRKQSMMQDARDNENKLALFQTILERDPHVYNGILEGKITTLDQALKLLHLSEGETATMNAVARKLGRGEITSQIRETNLGQGVAVRATEAKSIDQANYDEKQPLGANLAVVKLLRRAEQRIAEDGEYAVGYAKRHNRLDSGYLPAASDWFSKRPFMTDEEIENYHTLTEKPGEASAAKPKPPRSKQTPSDPLGIR
jgi:lysozyme